MPAKKSPPKVRTGKKQPVNKPASKPQPSKKEPKEDWPRRHPHDQAIAAGKGILDNPAHEAFAQTVAQGINPTQAYREVTGKNNPGAKVMAHRWVTKVNQRVRQIQAASATATTLTMQERRELLARRARTPISQINEHDVLCNKVVYVENEKGTKVTYEVPGIVEVLMADAKLAGELVDKKELSGEIRTPMTLAEFKERLAAAQA
jgi:hypothetical protein